MITTAEKSAPVLQKESYQAAAEQVKIADRQKSQPLRGKLDQYSSLLVIVLVVCCLVLAVNSQNVFMTETFKALLIIGFLNFIRLLTFSNN